MNIVHDTLYVFLQDSTPKDPERQAESHPHITTGEQPTSD